MALKENWVDKVDFEDYIKAEDINAIARAVIELEEAMSKISVWKGGSY